MMAITTNHRATTNHRIGTNNMNRRVTLGSSARSLLSSRFSRHPERYREILGVLNKYDLMEVVAELGLVHKHEEEDESVSSLLAERDEHELRHAQDLAKALEELGPCFIKLGQVLSTRPDILPP